MKEEWRDIKGYEGLYQVSNLGKVKRLTNYVKNNGVYGKTKKIKIKDRILTPINFVGYKAVKLCKNGIEKRYYLHRLIAETFIDNLENKSEVNHIDGNKSNNIIKNLEWVTHQENCKHRDNNKLRKAPSGEQHYLYGKHIKIGSFKSKQDFI